MQNNQKIIAFLLTVITVFFLWGMCSEIKGITERRL